MESIAWQYLYTGVYSSLLRQVSPRSDFTSPLSQNQNHRSSMRIWHILRTMLELQCDPFIDAMNSDIIERAFQNVVGLDIDPNAIEATKLSLSLFHLVVTGRFPERLNVVSTE